MHELDAVRAVCDNVAVLEFGKVVEQGPVEQVLLRPESEAARRLMRSELGNLGSARLRASSNSLLVELQFMGSVASQPIISELIRERVIEVDILRGRIDQINLTAYGFLLVEISGRAGVIERATAWLRARGVGVKSHYC